MVHVLHWLNPGTAVPSTHEMRLFDNPAGGSRLLLLLEKKQGPLTLEGVYPLLTATDFLTAWKKGEGEGGWQEADKIDCDGIFSAIRYVQINDTTFIVWRVDHRADKAYDTLSYFTGTLEEMRAFYARKTN